MRIKKTVLIVVAFLVLLILSAYAAQKASADPVRAYIELGRTTFNQELTLGGWGWRIVDKWDAQIRLTGQGETKRGYQNAVIGYGVSRVFSPGWELGAAEIKTRIGVAYSPDVVFVGDVNYRLGVIFAYLGGLVEVEIGHDSSADIWEVNTGVDAVFLRLML